MLFPQIVRQLGAELRKILKARATTARQRRGRGHVRARRAADAEVDPPRIQAREQGEDLGDFVGAVVGQHDATGADADALGCRTDGRQQHFRSATRHRGKGVVLGNPEAGVAELFTPARHLQCFLQRGGGLIRRAGK